jgi:hypothetical protein
MNTLGIDRRLLYFRGPCVLAYLAVGVDVLAEVFFEGFEQRELQLLDFMKLRFEPVDSIFERGGAGCLVGDLALLD